MNSHRILIGWTAASLLIAASPALAQKAGPPTGAHQGASPAQKTEPPSCPCMAEGGGPGMMPGMDEGGPMGRGIGGGMGMGKHGMRPMMMSMGPVREELMASLYPVELVRRYANEIKLSNDQMNALRKAVTEGHAELEKIKWDVEGEAQKLVELVKRGSAKDQISAQMDRVFQLENQIKKRHLMLMLDIRDILNAQQKAYLDKMKKEMDKDNAGQRRPGRFGPRARSTRPILPDLMRSIAD